MRYVVNCWKRTPPPLGEFISYTNAMSYQSALKIFNTEATKGYWSMVSIEEFGKCGMGATICEWRPTSDVRILTMDELKDILMKS